MTVHSWAGRKAAKVSWFSSQAHFAPAKLNERSEWPKTQAEESG